MNNQNSGFWLAVIAVLTIVSLSVWVAMTQEGFDWDTLTEEEIYEDRWGYAKWTDPITDTITLAAYGSSDETDESEIQVICIVPPESGKSHIKIYFLLGAELKVSARKIRWYAHKMTYRFDQTSAVTNDWLMHPDGHQMQFYSEHPGIGQDQLDIYMFALDMIEHDQLLVRVNSVPLLDIRGQENRIDRTFSLHGSREPISWVLRGCGYEELESND